MKVVNYRRARQWILVLGVALLGSGLVLAPPALAGPKKFYAASITPTTAAGNATVSFTLTITNGTSSQQNLGSANITIPSGLTSPVLGAVTPPPGKTWTAALVGSVIQLRNPGPSSSNALSAGQSVSVVVTVTTSCPGGTLVWLTAAKQSNDFSGTGNDFTLSGSNPTVTISGGCADHLAFGQQPTDITAGQSIAPAATVLVEDAQNNVVTSSSAAVTVALGSNPGPGTLFGTLTVNAQSGVATFSDLTVDTAGNGYTLAASSPGLTGATSSSFNVTGFAVQCQTSPCSLATGDINKGPDQNDTTIGSASVPVTPCQGTCPFLSLDEGTGSFCNGTCIGSTIIFEPPTNSNGDMVTIVLEYDKTIAPGTGVANFHVYRDLDGVVTEVFDCPGPGPSQSDLPCVLDRHRTHVGDLVITVVDNPIDPVWGTH